VRSDDGKHWKAGNDVTAECIFGKLIGQVLGAGNGGRPLGVMLSGDVALKDMPVPIERGIMGNGPVDDVRATRLH
jgi:hypothetical protein